MPKTDCRCPSCAAGNPVIYTRAHRLYVLALEIAALPRPLREARFKAIAGASREDAEDVVIVTNTLRAYQKRKPD